MSPGSWVENRPLWARWPWNAVSGVVLLALVAGVVAYVLVPPDRSCAEGVEKVGDQCIGVTDGSYTFTDNLRPVSQRIHQLNKQLEADEKQDAKAGGKTPPRHVGVVYLMPLRPRPQDTNTPDSVRHEIEGAYTAQYEANRTAKYGNAPKIKLLLANSGNTAEQHRAVLDRIRERIGTDHIVAVAGLGTSTDATARMIRRITSSGKDGLNLAATGAVLTADTLHRIKGLVRVAPTNSDEAAAAAAYLKDKPYARRVLVVRDSRPGDQYTSTLAKAFLRELPEERRVDHIEEYDSSHEGVATAFKSRMANLCAAKPDVVYFAGRGVDLPNFLAPLKNRPCTDRKLVVVSGDDASQVSQADGFEEIKETLQSGNVRLLYTGLAHPEAWQRMKGAYPGWAAQSFGGKGQYRAAFPDEPLHDGQAIMGHDAVLTTVAAVRMAAASNSRVTGSQTIQSWTSLHGVESVKGASGLISLENDGSPRRKAVPVIEIKPDGTVHTLDVSAGDGGPLTEDDLS